MKKKMMRMFTLIFLMGMVSACGGKSAGAYYKEGNQKMEEGKYEEAQISFSQAVQKNPERAEYYIASAFALIGMESFEEALNQFDKGYSEKDNQVVRENNKAIFRGRGIAFIRLGRYSEAIEEFQKALEIRESKELNSDIYKYMALTEIKLGNYAGAIKIYEDLMKTEKPDVEAYERLATAYRGSGEYEKAIQTYEEVIALDRDRFEAYFGQYESYLEMGREEEAKQVLEKAAGIKVVDDIGTYRHGILEYLRGNYDKAIVDLEVAYDKKIPETSYYLGRIYALKKDYESARTFYERYRKEIGVVTLSGWYDGMAECEMAAGENEKALKLVKKGLTMEDVSFTKNLYLKKISIEESLNHYLDAYDTVEEYLKRYPTDEKVLREKVFLKSRIKNVKK